MISFFVQSIYFSTLVYMKNYNVKDLTLTTLLTDSLPLKFYTVFYIFLNAQKIPHAYNSISKSCGCRANGVEDGYREIDISLL